MYSYHILSGDGNGKNTHISLFFVVMKGDFDGLLPWPFQQKVVDTKILRSHRFGNRTISCQSTRNCFRSFFQMRNGLCIECKITCKIQYQFYCQNSNAELIQQQNMQSNLLRICNDLVILMLTNKCRVRSPENNNNSMNLT